MATRKTTTTETVIEPGPEDKDKKDTGEIVVTNDSDTAEQDLIADLLAAGIEEEITYQVKRIAPADKAAYCTKYARGDLNLDRIREDWGAGTYTVTAFDAGNKYRKRVTVKIAESLKPVGTPASPTSTLAEMAQILRANTPPQVPQAMDMGAVLIGIMNSQTQMLTAILNRPAPTPPPPPDPLAMIAALKDVLKPAKESSEVEILLKGLNLGKDLAGGSEWTDVISKGLDSVVPLLGQARQGATGTPAARPTMRPRPPAPVGKQLPRTEPTEKPAPETEGAQGENVELLQKLNWLRRQAAVLCHQAAQDKDPGLYAEVFLDNLPEFFSLEEVHEHLSKPNAVEQLGQLHPPVLEHREWFTEFRDECLARIAEDEDETGTAKAPAEKAPVPEETPADGST